MSDTSPPSADAAAKAEAASKWTQMFLRRYPLASRGGMWLHAVGTLLSNGLIFWLLISGRMSPFELVLLVVLEFLLLTGIGWNQKRSVPSSALEPNTASRMELVVGRGVLVLVLAVLYGFLLADYDPSGAEALGALHDPFAFLWNSAIKWPLLITLVTAVIDVRKDHAHFRRHGGTFFSTPGLQGIARSLTLLLGSIPALVPAVAALVGLHWGVGRIHGWLLRRLGANHRTLVNTVLTIGVLALFVGTFLGLDRIDKAFLHVAWWALSFGAAKFVAELFVDFMPLIAATPVPLGPDEPVKVDGKN